MLTISPIHNIDYYARLSERDDYYAGNDEPEGQWAGIGARWLGLVGTIALPDYYNVMRGRSPEGLPLTENSGDEHRPGWDLTFSAPKSVSVVWARSDQEQRDAISNAHLQAVRSAVQFLEKHAAVTRRGHGGLKHEPTAGLVALLFEHATSRAQEPALHTHALVANVAPRFDGTWGTIESKYLYQWQKAGGAFYRAMLATQLRAIGYSIDRPEVGNHFEMAGIPSDICTHFSSRATAIKKALAAANAKTSASKIGNFIKLNTRAHKTTIGRPSLFTKWGNEMDRLGFTLDNSLDLIKSALTEQFEPIPQLSVVESLTEKRSVFRLPDIYEAIAIEAQHTSIDSKDIEATAKTLIDEKSVIHLGYDLKKNSIYSTPETLALEQSLIIRARSLNSDVQHGLREDRVQLAINNLLHTINKDPNRSEPFQFSEEQLEGIFSCCQSGLDLLQGSAGAGKTTAMLAVRLAHEAEGYAVIGATVARKAATLLEQETGIASLTIAKLVKDIHEKKLSLKNKVLVIDEAGQVSSKDLYKLVEAAYRDEAKVILVGEDKQLDSISHGGALRYLSKILGCARIENIKRQRSDWARTAVMQLRDGQSLNALETFQSKELLHWSPTADKCQDELVKTWEIHNEMLPHRQTLVLAQRWRDILPLSEKIRSIRQSKGLVKDENITLVCAVTEDRQIDFTFSTGDRIKLCHNDYKLGVDNGTLCTIAQIDSRADGGHYFHLKIDDGRNLRIDTKEYCDEKGRPYFALAYALTVYASQGCTVDDTLIYYTSGMDRANSYVAGSRHRESCRWFINTSEIDAQLNPMPSKVALQKERLLALANLMSIDNHKQLAIEYLAPGNGGLLTLENSRENQLEHEK